MKYVRKAKIFKNALCNLISIFTFLFHFGSKYFLLEMLSFNFKHFSIVKGALDYFTNFYIFGLVFNAKVQY